MDFGGRMQYLLLFGFLLLPCLVQASITVLSTGAQYRSRADDRLGKTFWRGYEYPARLQYLIGNSNACDDSEDWNITVPQDGQPVAILVRYDGCSLEKKARFISQRVHPRQAVKYMIIDGDDTLGGNMNEAQNEESLSLTEDQSRRLEEVEYELDDDTISIGIMHVSSASGNKLMASIIADSIRSGPRIVIDGGISDVGNREILLWMAISALFSACACTFMLAAHNGTISFLQREQENHQQHQRPQRRRLTREQVRRLFPRFEFDGTGLRPVNVVVPAGDGTTTIRTITPPEAMDLILCSICLDEYEAGDRIRVLPCGHAFKARCIGKWLAERSATCPLCKTEIWDDEDQSDSNDDEPVSTEPPSTNPEDNPPMTSQLWNMLRFGNDDAQAQAAPPANVWQEQQRQTPPRQTPTLLSPSAMASWVTQLVRRTRRRPTTTTQEMVETTNLNSLAEPLLQGENISGIDPLLQAENGGEPVTEPDETNPVPSVVRVQRSNSVPPGVRVQRELS